MGNIRELRQNLERCLKELNSIKNKKILNYEKAQPGSPTLKNIFVSGSPIINDTFLLYAIKDEELDEKYRIALAEYEFAEKEYNAEIMYLAKYDEFVLIEFLKNELGWTWDEIDKYLHKGTDSSRTKYSRHLEKIKKA